MIKKQGVKALLRPTRLPPHAALFQGQRQPGDAAAATEESESSLRAALGFDLHLKPGETSLSPLPTS